MPAETDRLEVYEATDGWRWKRVAANNRTLCTGESHDRQDHALRAALRSCPDLDPDWSPPAVVVDTRPLDLLDRLLDPDDNDDQDAIRDELGGSL